MIRSVACLNETRTFKVSITVAGHKYKIQPSCNESCIMNRTEQNRTELYLRTNSQATHRWRKRQYKQTDNKQRNRQCYNNKTYTDYVENVVAHLFIII